MKTTTLKKDQYQSLLEVMTAIEVDLMICKFSGKKFNL